MKTFEKFFPLGIVVLAGLMLAGKFFGAPAAKTRGMDLYAVGQIPVQHGGRIQPLSSVAQNTLVVISSKQEVVEVLPDKEEVTHKPIAWLLDVWARPEKADHYRVFRIEHPEILNQLGLPERPGSYRYSWAEVSAAEHVLERQTSVASGKDKDARSLSDKKFLELAQHYQLYSDLRRRIIPGLVPAEAADAKWTGFAEVEKQIFLEHGRTEFDKIGKELIAEIRQDPAKARAMIAKYEPNKEKIQKAESDRELLEQLFDDAFNRESMVRTQARIRALTVAALPDVAPGVAKMEQILDAYRQADAGALDRAVAEYKAEVTGGVAEGDKSRASLEARMNAFDPFLQCAALYVGIAVFALASWLGAAAGWPGMQSSARRAAFQLGVVTFAVHTAAMLGRMYIGNRPPVTNLYSSAVFIGWGGVLLCLALERWYKIGVGSFVAGLMGFVTVQIARFLAESGDTLEMLQAVLDTNLWLSTHVTTVSMGYVATIVAGVIGWVYIILGLFTPLLRGPMGKQVAGMIYGVICFATLLSFTGTVLGGIWADQSWGRFWGWDPKENGAVLIVIWNALILHARWGGLVKPRGMAGLAIVGNMVCAWSWFGTNQLGIGLHAYGFDNRLANGCAIWWILNAMIAALGLVPLKYWASFGPEPAKA